MIEYLKLALNRIAIKLFQVNRDKYELYLSQGYDKEQARRKAEWNLT